MKAGLRNTLSSAAVYGLGTVMSNAASVIMLPIYTRYLMPADYGLLEMLQMLADVIAIIFGMRVNAGIFRLYHEKDDAEHQRTVMSTSWITDVAFHALAALALLAVSKPAARLALGGDQYTSYVAIFAATLVTMATMAVPMAYLRALQRPWIFVSISISKLFLQLTLNIVFVVHLRWGPMGVIASTLITGVTIGGGISLWMFRRTGLRFSKNLSMRLVQFGFPMALASLCLFYTTYGDRFFIEHYWGLAEVGLYALAYRFAFALTSLVYGTFDQVWSTQAYVAYKQENRYEVFGRVFLMMMLGMLLIGTALAVMCRDIIRVMSDPAFVGAWKAIPPLIAAYVFRAANDFCGFGLRLSEQTRHFFWASLISVGVISVGYIGLIPLWGGLGGGLATLAGMATEFWWVYRTSNKLVPLHLPWTKIIAASVLCVIAFGLSMFLPAESLLTSIAYRSILLAALALAIYFSPIVGSAERNACHTLLRDGLRRVGFARA